VPELFGPLFVLALCSAHSVPTFHGVYANHCQHNGYVGFVTIAHGILNMRACPLWLESNGHVSKLPCAALIVPFSTSMPWHLATFQGQILCDCRCSCKSFSVTVFPSLALVLSTPPLLDGCYNNVSGTSKNSAVLCVVVQSITLTAYRPGQFENSRRLIRLSRYL